MPTLRAILGNLPETALASLADAAGLKRLDLDALERLGAGHIKVLLTDLPRASLKDACRALGLDDSGKEKVLLVDRLLPLDGRAPMPVATPSAPSAPRADPGKPAQTNLSAFLCSVADLLRGDSPGLLLWPAVLRPTITRRQSGSLLLCNRTTANALSPTWILTSPHKGSGSAALRIDGGAKNPAHV